MNIQTTLKKYGFSENEAEVYLCLLGEVDISAFHIAKKTGLPRTSVYHILDSLVNQGLISSWKKNNVAYFTAESPKRLIKILEDKREMIQSILPDIMNLKDVKGITPAAKLYTGVEGMKIVWNDILETLERDGLKELHAISHPKMFEHLPKFFPQWLKRREKLGIHSSIIMADSEETRQSSMSTNAHRETRLLPQYSPIKSTMDIYSNKIAFFSTKDDETYSIILESSVITEMMRQFFMATWELLGEGRRY